MNILEKREALARLQKEMGISHHSDDKVKIKTGIEKLDRYLNPIDSYPLFIEWGAPHGSLGRIFPVLLAKNLFKSCIWIFDNFDINIYPNSWANLGINLNRFHFITSKNPFKELGPLYLNDTQKLLVIDTKLAIKKSEYQFLYQQCIKNKFSIFFIRHFYLSNRNGNPFCKHRINASYSLEKDVFSLNFIKGSNKKFLSLKRSEVCIG